MDSLKLHTVNSRDHIPEAPADHKLAFCACGDVTAAREILKKREIAEGWFVKNRVYFFTKK